MLNVIQVLACAVAGGWLGYMVGMYTCPSMENGDAFTWMYGGGAVGAVIGVAGGVLIFT